MSLPLENTHAGRTTKINCAAPQQQEAWLARKTKEVPETHSLKEAIYDLEILGRSTLLAANCAASAQLQAE